jgi:hypothetical protein
MFDSLVLIAFWSIGGTFSELGVVDSLSFFPGSTVTEFSVIVFLFFSLLGLVFLVGFDFLDLAGDGLVLRNLDPAVPGLGVPFFLPVGASG